MTLPFILLCLLVALLFGALWHLLRGGGFWRLVMYLLLSCAGFFTGHFFGAWRGWIFIPLGPLNLGMASLGSVLFMAAGDWLGRIDAKRKTDGV